MKKLTFALITLLFSSLIHAAPEKSWWDDFKESIGISSQQAEADSEDKAKPEKPKPRTKLTEAETAKLQAWLAEQKADQLRGGKGLPKGLQKKVERGGELPPGWTRKVAAGDRLTEEEYENAQRIPDRIRAEIGIPEEVAEVIQVGDSVATVVRDTREIIDIITGK